MKVILNVRCVQYKVIFELDLYADGKSTGCVRLPNVDGNLSGWLQFTVTPADLAQGGNFIIVLPNAAMDLKANEALLELDDIAQKMPTVDHGMTYAGLFYVMEAMKRDGIQIHWNGEAWTISTDMSVNVTATTENPQPGDIPVVVNGTTVGYLPALAAPDGWTNRQTTYVSIPEFNAMLKSVFGVSANWVYGK